jgi:hypothetical protein
MARSLACVALVTPASSACSRGLRADEVKVLVLPAINIGLVPNGL